MKGLLRKDLALVAVNAKDISGCAVFRGSLDVYNCKRRGNILFWQYLYDRRFRICGSGDHNFR